MAGANTRRVEKADSEKIKELAKILKVDF